jgi:ABC-type multidrug transport system fused ATPase/permease subunit
LRKKITVITQDPTLFKGTLKFNLDPENEYSDKEIMKVLKKANLSKIIAL